jgi:uncharacterized protein (DUF1015 family)
LARIYPFHPLRYTAKAGPLANVVTQPYDKISPAMRSRYLALSPFNLVRVILGEQTPTDSDADNIYTRAAQHLDSWTASGILQRDSEPGIFPYFQEFNEPDTGERLVRKGFIALGAVEEYSAGIVHRHEQTLSGPKKDRLELLRHTHAHFGQLFMLYPDKDRVIDALLDEAAAAAPLAEVTDEYGAVHRIWKIAGAAMIQQLMADKRLLIADGHHRYETALNYRNECRTAAGANSDREAAYEFVMMTFVNMNDPGLLVLPTHRVVHSLESFSVDDFQKTSREFFEVEEVDSALDGARATELLRERGRAGTALLAVTPNRAFVLHSPKAAGAKFFAGLSARQRALDVVQLHKCLLEGVLKLSEESIRNQQNLSYLRDASESLAQVRKGAANIAFLMNPCPVSQVRDIALAGEVMPQKSTDFYPKLLSGLTAYALD